MLRPVVSLGVWMAVLEEGYPQGLIHHLHIPIPLKCLLTQCTIIIPSPTVKTEMSLNTVNISLHTDRLQEVVFDP